MKLALEEAHRAMIDGEIPIGAVLVADGKVIARAHNKREHSKNPLQHAEMCLLQESGQQTGDWRLAGTTLYVTLEPCPMCLGALFQARVEHLVFGCLDPKREEDNFFPSLKNFQTLKANNHFLNVTGGVLAEECSQLLKDFFRQRREKYV